MARRLHPKMRAMAACVKKEWRKRGRKGMPTTARRRLFGQVARDCARQVRQHR